MVWRMFHLLQAINDKKNISFKRCVEIYFSEVRLGSFILTETFNDRHVILCFVAAY